MSLARQIVDFAIKAGSSDIHLGRLTHCDSSQLGYSHSGECLTEGRHEQTSP